MKLLKLAAALGLALSVIGASAQTVMSFQDDNIDFLLNANLTPKTSGAFATGDVLVSVFEMPTFTIGGVNAIPAGQELTGIAAIQIVGGTGSAADPFTFSPYSGGFNAISPVAVTNGGAGQGAMVAMWLNSTADFDLELDFAVNLATNCTSFAQCLAEASAGNPLQVDGFAGDPDEYWQSVITRAGGNDPSVVAQLGPAFGVATFDAALTTFFNATGPIAFQNLFTGAYCPAGTNGADNCVQGPTITGPITGGAGLNPALIADGAFARSDIDARKLQLQVPEPGTLALVGLSLLGLAGTRRRRQ